MEVSHLALCLVFWQFHFYGNGVNQELAQGVLITDEHRTWAS